jgi:hypothetical protein
MSLCPMCSAATRIALDWSAHGRGYKLLRVGADPKSLFVVCELECFSVRCVSTMDGASGWHGYGAAYPRLIR